MTRKKMPSQEDRSLCALAVLCHGKAYPWVESIDNFKLGRPICEECEIPMSIHRRRRNALVDYRCSRCRQVANALSGTVFSGSRRRPSQIVRIIIGMLRSEPTIVMARKVQTERAGLIKLRKVISKAPWFALLREPQEIARLHTGGIHEGILVQCLGDGEAIDPSFWPGEPDEAAWD